MWMLYAKKINNNINGIFIIVLTSSASCMQYQYLCVCYAN